MAEAEDNRRSLPTSLNYILKHVFLLPKLPQEDDSSFADEEALIQRLLDLLQDFLEHLSGEARGRWHVCADMLRNMLKSHVADCKIKEVLVSIGVGDALLIQVRAQNVALLARKVSPVEYTFELFELSPTNEAVMQGTSRSRGYLPGPTNAVGSDLVQNSSFLDPHTEIIVKLDQFTPAEALQHVKKAKSTTQEIRNTVDPTFMTEMVISILRGAPNGYFPKSSASANFDDSNGCEGHQMVPSKIDVEGYNEGGPTRTPLITSRAQSPYTQHPTIDSDDLSWPCRGTLQRKGATEKEKEERLAKLSSAVRTILECVGEDPDREGLLDTPKRYAKAMLFFTKGYEENLRAIVNGAVFHEDHDEMVIVKDIEFFSLCEHHLVPFSGKMHIAYIPNRRVIGLSKIARMVEMFSRRFQIQERLTKQVAFALSEILQPQGVAVIVESSHLCMVMRGVQKTGAITTTSCMLGRLQSTAKTREEFLNLISRK